jgi:transcription initiation factor TFIID subunit 5
MSCVSVNGLPAPVCVFLTVQSESGCANMVSAAPCQAEPQQYEVQFGRLRSFLTGKSSAWGEHGIRD